MMTNSPTSSHFISLCGKGRCLAVMLSICAIIGVAPVIMARTLIHPSQIEDVYLRNTGDASTGDIVAATSQVMAATLVVNGSDTAARIFLADDVQEKLWITTNGYDIRIDPNYGVSPEAPATAFIQLGTTVGFDDVLGDKITFWSHSYKIGLSPFDLDVTSDRNIKFHSDTAEDLFQILGDEGDIVAKNNVTAGANVYAVTAFRFVEQQPGDKIYLYYPNYKISISPNDLDVFSDRYIRFHSDTNEDAMVLDADPGDLTVEGRMKAPSAVFGATDDPPAGYSLVADSAWIGNLNSTGSSDFGWTVSGNNVLSNVSGNVGIATSETNEKLTLDGVLSLSNQAVDPTTSSHYGKIFSAPRLVGQIAPYTSLLLHSDGADGATSFSDSAISAHVMTAYNGAQTDTDAFKFGTSSAKFDGTNDYIDAPDHADWNVGGDDFTVDFWFKRDGGTGAYRYFCGQYIDAPANGGVYLLMRNTNLVEGGIYYGISYTTLQHTSAITDANWHHVAFSRSGDYLRLFVDGVNSATATVTGVTVNNSSSRFAVGRMGEYNQDYWKGWIDEFRFSKGIARWTESFTPPTSPYPDGYFDTNALYFLDENGRRYLLSAWEEDESGMHYQGGYLGLGTEEPQRVLEIGVGHGNARADGWDVWSAAKFKKDIEPLTPEDRSSILGELQNAPLCYFRYKGEPNTHRKRLGYLVEQAPQSIISPDGLSISLSDGLGLAFAAQMALLDRIDALERSLVDAGIPLATPTATPAPAFTPMPTATATPVSATQESEGN